jgi:hypothetical protein
MELNTTSADWTALFIGDPCEQYFLRIYYHGSRMRRCSGRNHRAAASPVLTRAPLHSLLGLQAMIEASRSFGSPKPSR